jgi:ribosomal protein S18 acetylase RimI-like enzyme
LEDDVTIGVDFLDGVENLRIGHHHDATIANVEPLDNPIWHALTGPQSQFAAGSGLAVRYEPDVGLFAAMPDSAGPESWAALAELLAPDDIVGLFRADGVVVPSAFHEIMRLPGHQMVATEPIGRPDPAFLALDAADVEEMLALVGRTQPGPFFARTNELGTYLGWRDESGALAAMAGERMHLRGYTEISAVCTDESARKQGLATRLVRAVAAGVEQRGETPMLHVAADNVNAIRVYEALGFSIRVTSDFTIIQAHR